MYYFQIVASIVFLIGLAGSLIYLILLSVRVATNRVSKKEARRKTFITTFCMWSSLFLLVIIGQDKTGWNLVVGIIVFIVLLVLATVLSVITTAGLWLGKHWRE